MKLSGLNKGSGFWHKFRLWLVGLAMREPPSDVVRALFYRPKLFGAPIGYYCHELLRGPSEWTVGEREIFATFVSRRNSCEFCSSIHRAVAIRALDTSVVDAALEDFGAAPVSERARAVLGFLDKLSKDPTSLEPADVALTRSAGVSVAALETAVRIAAVFNVINRVADALGFDIPSASLVAKESEHLLKHGYKPMPF